MTDGDGTSGRIRAATYVRISEDPTGQERGVTRQADDCDALADGRGWTVVARYRDNDISALRGKPRPGYQALLDAAERGEFDHIVIYGLSRLWRSRSERAVAMDRLSRARVGVAMVKGTDLDFTSASGRMYAGILGEFDTAESELKAERVARASLQRAREGKANGAVAFGWRRDYVRDASGRVLDWRDLVDERQASVVRSIVGDLLAGKTLRSITARLNEARVPSPQGKRFITSSVRKLALRELNVGLRTHRGEVIGKAALEPLVSELDHSRVKALLADPVRRTQKAASRTHLLTFGIGKCGVCGGVLAVKRTGPAGAKQALYVCKESGCVGRRESWVDDLVVATVCHRLARPDAWDVFAPDESVAAAAGERVSAIRARLDGAADMYAAEKIDASQLARISERLTRELEEAEGIAIRADTPRALTIMKMAESGDVRASWDALELSQRRAVLETLQVQVVIHRARGGPGFKPESVSVTWGS
ncbi:recombinase family protein [Rhodococcoides fascians]|uniref:recombinase family protein n=1 Tax=Rhodococcoides fascians TaxID=1828 RepID=UPI001D1B5363|nr:recombinase family protein [Rhodococcus fascians]CAH0311209.1 hypothetical protein SRABI91_04940 [Rhodococcus fascians]